MRPSNKQVSVVITQNVTAAKEDVISYSVFPDKVVLWVGYYTQDDELLTRKEVEIAGDYFVTLMSESPEFAPGKPAGAFRNEDLWFIIDQIESA